ncbi:hypothetical protein LLG95_04190 [bacterium]|nr:hypothetical protein [bacterium]
MPVALAIQTGGLSTFLAFGNWSRHPVAGGRIASLLRPGAESDPRVIDIAPKAEAPVASLPYRQILGYTRPCAGEAPRLCFASAPAGQTIDVTV